MSDDTRTVKIDDLHFEKRQETLPAELIDRIILIHYVFRDYLEAGLDETIDNFKYDTDPETEIRTWERMAGTVLRLKEAYDWPYSKMQQAVKFVLGLSMGVTEHSTIEPDIMAKVLMVWNDRDPH